MIYNFLLTTSTGLTFLVAWLRPDWYENSKE